RFKLTITASLYNVIGGSPGSRPISESTKCFILLPNVNQVRCGNVDLLPVTTILRFGSPTYLFVYFNASYPRILVPPSILYELLFCCNKKHSHLDLSLLNNKPITLHRHMLESILNRPYTTHFKKKRLPLLKRIAYKSIEFSDSENEKISYLNQCGIVIVSFRNLIDIRIISLSNITFQIHSILLLRVSLLESKWDIDLVELFHSSSLCVITLSYKNNIHGIV
ncbi:hypothetical protein L9F63_002347, partial [Diploptera punctata]